MEWERDLTKFELCWFKTLSTSTEKLISNNSTHVEVFKDMQTNHNDSFNFIFNFIYGFQYNTIKKRGEKSCAVQITIALRVLSPPASKKLGNQYSFGSTLLVMHNESNIIT